MPTTTSTIIKQPSKTTHFPIKLQSLSSDDLSPQTSTSASLRSLYTRAARAFVLRDIQTTSSLLVSAFSILKPPKCHPDALSDDRKKWDILRITFESTVYSSPPASSKQLPESIRYIITESPQALVSSMYTRSLTLFSASGDSKKSAISASCLPSQVLTTLVYCSIKLGAPDFGRVMIEEWLARRELYDHNRTQGDPVGDGYDKIIELYCLQVLPKLGQWDYVKEFLEYESELAVQRREELKMSFQSLHSQAVASKRFSSSAFSSSLLENPKSPSPRSYSPAPSSSVSTTSTHTVIPATPRGRSVVGLSSISSRRSPPSDESCSSNGTAIPLVPNQNGHKSLSPRPTNHDRERSKSRTYSSTSSVYSNIPQTRVAQELSRSERPTTVALIKASLAPYLTSARLPTLLLIFVFIPLISFVLRRRRRKRLASLTLGAANSANFSNADFVRRRLLGAETESGVPQRAWRQVVRVVTDTLKMAGGGLV